MYILVQDYEVANVFKRQVTSFVQGSGQLTFGPTVRGMAAYRWTE
jgi:hypothetical protein